MDANPREFQILIIADDLTGAADCGAACAAHGLVTVVVLDDGEGVPEARVVAIDANTRSASPQQAAAEVRRIVRKYPAGIVYKKIDSTLRGHVRVEVDAALEAYRSMGHPDAIAVVAPAFPAMGRTTRGGRMYVRGFAIEGCGLSLEDAETDDDLWAIAYRWLGGNVLWVGSAGLMRWVAECAGLEQRAMPPVPKTDGPIIFAVGSYSGRSREQVEALRAAGIGSDLVLTGEPDTLASAVTRIRKPGGLVLTGGDTARAVLRAMGIAALRVVGEVETGVPILMTEGAIALPVVTKAGDFGDRETLLRCRAALRGREPL